MALAALQLGVVAVEQRDLACEATFAQRLDVDLGAWGSLCQSVSFSGRVSAWIRPSRMMRGLAECGSWQKMQFSEWLVSLTNSFTLDNRLHLALGSASPR